jgi:hypothetical protein
MQRAIEQSGDMMASPENSGQCSKAILVVRMIEPPRRELVINLVATVITFIMVAQSANIVPTKKRRFNLVRRVQQQAQLDNRLGLLGRDCLGQTFASTTPALQCPKTLRPPLTGPYFDGYPPTGRTLTLPGASFVQVERDKIRYERVYTPADGD